MKDNGENRTPVRGHSTRTAPGMQRSHAFGLAAVSVIFLAISSAYLLNLVRWSHGPDFGWGISHQLGARVLIAVRGEAARAGLVSGDELLSINGQDFQTFLQLQDIVLREPGQVNRYTVRRNGQALTVSVPNRPIGFGRAFLLYGATWALGGVFFLMGAAVVLMKPDSRASWLFLCMTFFAGLFISFSNASRFTPSILNNAIMVAYAFLPSSILMLGAVFPEERKAMMGKAALFWSPYLLSCVLFGLMRSAAGHFADVPVRYRTLAALYLALSLFLFLAGVIHTLIKSRSVLSRARARVILAGAAVAAVIPVLDLLSSQFLRLAVIPHPALNLPFYLFFPLAVAYSIARHNLFDVDVYIKRTVGYIIMTLVVGSLYASMQVSARALMLEKGLGNVSERVMPVLFALLVVFFFNPVNARVQGAVDRLFYRRRFDYKDTVAGVSAALTSVLNLQEIILKVLDTLRGGMFIDRAGIILEKPGGDRAEAVFSGDQDNPSFTGLGVPHEQPGAEDSLLSLVKQEGSMVTSYDIQEDSRFAGWRDTAGKRMAELGSTVLLPLKIKGQVTGLLALGNKKSGHFYTREDLDLLETLCNQAAIAIDNARLFEENLEKGRMEEELKIARDLQTSMLPLSAPVVPGFEVASRCLPAREVGGDFYDFLEMGDPEEPGKLGLVVADVSGKAVSGALVMSAARSLFRAFSDGESSVSQVMKAANARLNRDVRKGTFVALVFAVLDPSGPSLTISNAGQTQPLLLPGAGGGPRFLESEGDRFPLGILPESDYREKSVPLTSGDTLFFYTDGVVEAMDSEGAMYGFERFEEIAAREALLGGEAERILGNIVADVLAFAGGTEQHDDITLVVVKVK